MTTSHAGWVWTQDPWGWWRLAVNGREVATIPETGSACTCTAFNRDDFRSSDCPHLVAFRAGWGSWHRHANPTPTAATAQTLELLQQMRTGLDPLGELKCP